MRQSRCNVSLKKKSISSKKSGSSLWEIFVSCTSQNYYHVTRGLIHFSTIICQGVAYRRLKQTKLSISSKSGRGRLQEVVDYKRFQIYWFDLENFSILENWSLRRGVRKRRFDCTYIFKWIRIHWDDKKPTAFENLDCSKSLWHSTYATEKPSEARGSRGGKSVEYLSRSQPPTPSGFAPVSSSFVILSVRSTIE